MNKYIISTVVLLLLTGCFDKTPLTSVKCDSGFSTPYSAYSTIYQGTVHWDNKQYKMVDGETCWTLQEDKLTGIFTK